MCFEILYCKNFVLQEVAFLSNIGGTFGLFIGLSVITLLEGIELIGTVIIKIIKRFLRQRKYRTIIIPKNTY